MGLLVDGQWQDRWYDTKQSGGKFVRAQSKFRNWVTVDGSAGPSGDAGYQAEAGRYHLYVSLACPWAHRTLILRALKGLEAAIGLSVVHWHMGENGWEFRAGQGTMPDTVNNASFLYEVYQLAQTGFSGRVTVPVLWDRERGTIVSNESSEIIRMFNGAFDAFAMNQAPDFYPPALRGEIDTINAQVYETINNGVYRCGFATSQDAYDEAYDALFATLDELEQRLSRQRYLVGSQITEADWRLFTTLVRFDPVYHGHFKCNRQRLKEFPNLWNYVLDLHAVPGVAATVDMHHIKQHYYGSHESVNPTGIVPRGPDIDYNARHDRNRFATNPR